MKVPAALDRIDKIALMTHPANRVQVTEILNGLWEDAHLDGKMGETPSECEDVMGELDTLLVIPQPENRTRLEKILIAIQVEACETGKAELFAFWMAFRALASKYPRGIIPLQSTNGG